MSEVEPRFQALSPFENNIFGSWPVHYAEKSIAASIDTEDVSDTKWSGSEAYEHGVEKGLDKVRQKLESLSGFQREVLNNYCESSIPQYMLNNKKDSYFKGDWATWLGEVIGNESLLNFLQWHNGAINGQQGSPEIQAEIESKKTGYKVAIRNGVRDGWLHRDALGALKTVDKTKVYIGDVFCTWMNEAAGYHVPGTREIVMAAAIGNTVLGTNKNIRRNIWHEYNHSDLGSFAEPWVNEALAEHTARSMEEGEAHILEPVSRKNVSGIYLEVRGLLADVLKRGKIPVSAATLAYSEIGEGPNTEAFKAATDKAWLSPHESHVPGTALMMITMFIGGKMKDLRASGMRETIAMNQAVLHAHGQLLRRPELIFRHAAKESYEPAIAA